MKIQLNTDKELVEKIQQKLKENHGYCPCKLKMTPENKCMCKEFKDMIARGIEGECHCGLFIASK